MNKLLKWLLSIVGVVAILIVVATIVLPMVIDPNNYKDEIRTVVLEETGRELTIGGEIQWSVFPSVGLELSDVSLSDVEGQGGQPLLDIGGATLSMKLMPLFKRRVEVSEVKLSGMAVNLPADSSGGAPAGSGIEITGADVVIKNTGQAAAGQIPGSDSSKFILGGPFDLDGSFTVNIPEEQLTGDVVIDGQIQSLADGNHLRIDGLNLSFNGQQGAGAESVPLELTVSTNVDFDLDNDQAALSDLVFQLYDVVISGDLKVTSVSTDPQSQGQLKVAQFNPKSLMKDLGMEVPVTRNESALTKLQADMNFSGSGSLANMQNLTVIFDESTFQGNLTLESLAQPKLTFDFEIDRLNLDDYQADSTDTGTGNTGEGADEGVLSSEAFRGFTGGGDFRIGELIVAGLTATDVSLTMNSNGNTIRFYPVNALFYGGQHEGEINIDASGSRPILTADHRLTGVQAQGLLQDLTGSASMEGRGDFHLKISSDLSTSDSMMRTLSGDMSMRVLDGAIVGIDVAKSISLVQSVLGRQSDEKTKGGQDQKTEFAELSMSGVIDKGVLTSDDLNMQSTLLRATGEGAINLVDESINYLLKPELLGDQVDPALAALSGTPIPIRLTGNLYEPDIKVDIVAAIAASQKELIDQKTDEIIGQLLGSGDDSGEGEKDADTSEKEDPVNSLLNNVFGSKKDKKKKKKKDDGGGL